MRVLITGADGALGRATVQRFRQAGDQVASLCGTLTADDVEGGNFAAGNLSDETNARDVVNRAVAWLGGVDALVHLVGGFRWAEVESTSIDDWRALFATNVETSVATVKAVLPSLKEGASIVTVGAASAQPAGVGFAAYATAKSGVARLTEALSAELRSRRIRVNAVLPSIIDTPQNRKDMPDADTSTWTSPEAIADVIRFLASDASRAITGALVPVTNAA